MSKPNRPFSVTLISWFLIGTSIYSLFIIPLTASNPATAKLYAEVWAGFQPIMSILGVAFPLVSGIAMLKAKDWGRKLYLISTPILTLITLLILGSAFLVILLFGVAFYILVAFFLLREDASNYFKGIPPPEAVPVIETRVPAWQTTVPKPPEEPNNARRFGAIAVLCLASIVLISWIMMAGVMSEHLLAMAILSGVFLMISGALVFLAVWLWGRNRWLIVTGSFLTACAALTFMMGAMFLNLASPEMQKVFEGQSVDPSTILSLGKSSMVASLFPFAIGLILIFAQKRVDKRRAQLGLN